MLRHRCERSPVSPTDSAARKRAAASAVAGEGVSQAGAEAPSPETPGGPQASLAHALVCVVYTHALTQGTRMHTGKPTSATKMHYKRISLENEGNSQEVVALRAPVLRRDDILHVAAGTYGPSHLHSAEACPVVRMLPCSGYHPMGSRGVVEPRARAVGANGIERCPPHVYP